MTGAMLVVGVPAALSRVRPAERPGTGARVFSGIGEGIATSGTLVPWLVATDVALTWLAMAGDGWRGQRAGGLGLVGGLASSGAVDGPYR